jgi:hypothetical protein
MGSSVFTNEFLWYRMVIMGKTMDLAGGDRQVVRNLCTFCLIAQFFFETKTASKIEFI